MESLPRQSSRPPETGAIVGVPQARTAAVRGIRGCAAFASTIALLCCLCVPPWSHVERSDAQWRLVAVVSWAPLWSPPESPVAQNFGFPPSIAWGTLTVEIAVIGVSGIALWAAAPFLCAVYVILFRGSPALVALAAAAIAAGAAVAWWLPPIEYYTWHQGQARWHVDWFCGGNRPGSLTVQGEHFAPSVFWIGAMLEATPVVGVLYLLGYALRVEGFSWSNNTLHISQEMLDLAHAASKGSMGSNRKGGASRAAPEAPITTARGDQRSS